MWMDETKSSFEMAKAKIDGRDISYPYLLDAKGEPRLQCTNAFMIWFCERCDIVVKKTVVEKAESWLMACGNLSRVKFDPNGPGLTKGIFTQVMLVKVAIKGHQISYVQIQTAVAAAEEDEKVSASAAEQALVRSQAAAIKEIMAPELQAATDAGKAAIQLANAIPVATGRLAKPLR